MDTDTTNRILIVDDEPDVLSILSRFLEIDNYNCDTAESAEDAIECLKKAEYGLLISDINMPGMSGIDLLREVRKNYPDMAVIMVTAVDDRKVATHTLTLGAYGYIIKPFDRNEVVINVVNALRRRELEIDNRKYQEELESLVDERTIDLRQAEQNARFSREETIQRLAKAAEFRDNETAQHTLRMSHFCKLLAIKSGLPQDKCEMIRMASPLHDVGKIGIPDSILNKPGKLTTEEFDIIKEHCEIGYRILGESESELLSLASLIAYTHHEKIDGSGYPQGLSDDDIPIEGRIAAICDVFDALTSDRPYKSAFPIEKALDIIREGQGTHFDSRLTDIFLASVNEVLGIKKEFADKS